MAKLWTDFNEISEFARWAAKTYDIEVLIRSVDDGWILPFFTARWNLVDMTEEELENYRCVLDRENWWTYSEEDDETEFVRADDDASYGLSPMLGDTVEEGYHEFGESWVED